MVVVVQLHFSTAFALTNMNAIHRTLKAYGISEADMELLRRMQAGFWYSVFCNFFNETAAHVIDKRMKQGGPTGPARYITFMLPLIRTFCASGRGWKQSS
jgi:hypothetical protein